MSHLSDRARRLIDDARGAEAPSRHDRSRVHRRLAIEVGLAAAGVAVGAKAAVGGTLANLAVAAALVGAGAGAGLVHVRSRPRLAPVVEPAAAPSPRIDEVRGARRPPAMLPEAPRPRPRVRGAAADTLQGETALLASAQEAVRGDDATRALFILDDYARRFPSGVLREEGAATRVFALAALGSAARACGEGRRFLARWPRSPLAARVRAACADRR